jgi:membrane protease YdiL (CAAX protease family)
MPDSETINGYPAPLRGGAFYLLLGLLYIFFADGVYRQYYSYIWFGGNGPSLARNTVALLGSMAVSWGVYAVGLLALCRLFGLSKSDLGLKKPAEHIGTHIASGAFLGVLVYTLNVWFVTGVLYLVQQGSPRAFYAFHWSFPGLSAVPNLFAVLSLLNVIVVAPVMEELTFRGGVYTLLSRRIGVRWSVLATSALFSLTHLTINKVFFSGNDPSWVINQFVYHFLGGLLYNILFIRSRSLVAPVSAHIAYNFCVNFMVRTLV